MNKAVKLLNKWLDDPSSVTDDELKACRKSAIGNAARALDWAIDGYRSSAEYYLKRVNK